MANKFKVGDFVWAKMKSYHPWPGKIAEPESDVRPPADKKPKQFVFFFGTENCAWIAEDQIWPYVKFKSKFMITQKVPQSFTEAVNDLEEELQGSGDAAVKDQEDAEMGDKNDADEPPTVVSEARNTKQTASARKSKQPSSQAASNVRKKPQTSAKKEKPVERKKRKLTTEMINRNTALYLPDIISSQAMSSADEFVISSTVPLKIGFLGLGNMGSRIASALLQSGHDVTVWNRTPSKCRDFMMQGARKGMSAADVVQSCDITFCCVADSFALKEVVSGECGVLSAIKPGKSFVDMSSVEVESAVELYESVTVRGGRFLEAPLLGTLLQEQDNERQLPIVLTAGDFSLYEDCVPYFDSFTKKNFYLGEVGSATSMKLVVNMLFGTTLAGVAETLALGEKVGLRQEQILEILALMPISSKLNLAKGDAMVNGKFSTPQLSLEYMERGLRTAIAIAEPVEQSVVVTAATNELFKKAKARGYGDHDTSAIFRATD